jgi:hypothetical protein
VRSFEISYPVVGTVRWAISGDPASALLIAHTYLNPIMSAAFDAYHRRSGGPAMPGLLSAWQHVSGPFDVEGGVHEFDPTDGLVALLSSLGSGADRPVLDTSRLVTPDGSPPAPIDEVVRAIIDLLARAIVAQVQVSVEDLP